MRKGLKIAGSTVFAAALSSCLFYCMVAGAKSGAVVYVVMAALLSVIISVWSGRNLSSLMTSAGRATRTAITSW